MLYLHIGSMKTGTSTIQSFLKEYRDELPHQQLDTFSIGNASKLAVVANTPSSYAYWVDHRKIYTKEEYKALQTQLWIDAKAEKNERPNTDFIASSEFIYNDYENYSNSIENLASNLTELFGEVTVILYLRNQVDFIKSLYSQLINGSTKGTISYSNFIKNLHNIRHQWDYAEKVRTWSAAFGNKNLRVVVFDRSNFPNGNLLEDFLMRVNISDFEIDETTLNKRVNVSHTFLQLNLIRICNNTKFTRKKLRKFYLHKITNSLEPKEFPKKYDQEIIDLVAEGNRWLNDTWLSEFRTKLPTTAD